MKRFLILICVFAAACAENKSCVIDKSHTEILNSLLGSHDFRLRPGHGGAPVDVNVSLWIYNIGPISETNMNIRLDFYMTQYWIDERLQFKEQVCNELKTYSFDTDHMKYIWHSDVYFPHALDSELHEVTKTNKAFWLRSDGLAQYSIRVTLINKCPMHFSLFPFDIQSCSVDILSYSYPTTEMELHWMTKTADMDPLEIENEEKSTAQFGLLKKAMVKSVTRYHTGMYSKLDFVLVFKRYVGYYIIQSYVPGILCVALSWVSFWIKRDATPARASLGITTVLAVVTLLVSDNWSLPRISTIKAIEVYLFSCLLFVFGALIEFSAVCYFSKPRFERRSLPNCEEDVRIETSLTEKILLNHSPEDNAEQDGGGDKAMVCGHFLEDECRCDQNGKNNQTGSQLSVKQVKLQFAGFEVGKIDVFSRYGFPAAFGIFNFIYWCFYLSLTTALANEHSG